MDSDIQKLQKMYFDVHKKNTFFKNDQKLDCAKFVASQIPIKDLVEKTIYILPNTNKIYYDYTVFKKYACEEIIEPIYNHFQMTLINVVKAYGFFEFHINVDTFTVSAAHRYSTMIQSSLNSNNEIMKRMTKMYMYYTPSVTNIIITILGKTVKQYLPICTFYSKTESDERHKNLFHH